MAELEHTRNEVIYKREIITDEPNAHAELILKVEGLPENTLGVLRMKFNSLIILSRVSRTRPLSMMTGGN